MADLIGEWYQWEGNESVKCDCGSVDFVFYELRDDRSVRECMWCGRTVYSVKMSALPKSNPVEE